MDSHSLCVLVPALNEVANLRPTVETISRGLADTTASYEIIIVDDGSSDGTGELADQLAREAPHVRVIHNPVTRGIGYAYVLGYENTKCDYFVYIPGDNTWPYPSCRKLFSSVGSADIVTSYSLNPEVRALGRRILSPLYTAALNLLFRRRMRYYNGLTIYPVKFLRTGPVSTFGFGFQAEVLLKALAAGLSYLEVGLHIDERVQGRSKAVSVRNIVDVIALILRLRRQL